MHEMSVAINLLELAEQEAKNRGCQRLVGVTVQYGQISGIMPEALKLAFKAATQGTLHANASLTLEMLPLRLRCPFCQTVFGGRQDADLFAPCPGCGEDFGHIVEQGKELLLSRVEAIPE